LRLQYFTPNTNYRLIDFARHFVHAGSDSVGSPHARK
jgi:hypothetical protein